MTVCLLTAFPPTFVQGGKLQSTTVAFRGLSTTLICSASGSPSPTYKWHFRDLLVVEDTNVHILQIGNLVINNVQFGNAGKYTCIATNQKGSINQSTVVKVYCKFSC